MKRRMTAAKAPNPESHMRVKDPGMLAAKAQPKKTDPDVFPTRKVPAKGRPTGGGNARMERLANKRI